MTDKEGRERSDAADADVPADDVSQQGAEADEFGQAAQEQEAAAAEESDLEQQLANARAALQETEQNYLRAVADLRNYKRRMQRELADRMQFANEQLLGNLLPVLDNFRFAIDTTPSHADATQVLAGVRMILQQFEDLLASYGVQPVVAEAGADFDPAVHEAAELVAAGLELQGKVVEELARGYMFRDRLLRPARVKAGAIAPAEEGSNTQGKDQEAEPGEDESEA